MSEETDKFNLRQEDYSLIHNFVKGDIASFDKLVIKYKDKIFNLCFKFLADYEEASDCAQETFVSVYRSLKSFRFEAAFSTWIYKIAVNICRNKLVSADYRRKKKMIRLDVPLNDTGESDCVLEIGDSRLTPEVELEKDEKNQIIQEAIESLSSDQREVVVLRDIEMLSYEDISRVTGLNLGTVKSKLSRARMSLADKLRGRV